MCSIHLDWEYVKHRKKGVVVGGIHSPAALYGRGRTGVTRGTPLWRATPIRSARWRAVSLMYTRTRALLVVWSGLIVAVAALAGCGIAHRTQAQDQANLQAARNAQLVTQSDFALADCNAKFPAGNPKIQVARMRCLNDALAIQMPIFGPYQDLMQTWMAARMAVAEQIQNRKMTIAEGDAIIAEKWSQVVSEK